MITPGTLGPLAGPLAGPLSIASPDIAGELAPAGLVLGVVMASAVGILLLAADRRRPAPLRRSRLGHGVLTPWRRLAGAIATLLCYGGFVFR